MEIQNLNFDVQTNMVKDSKASNKNQNETKNNVKDNFSNYINKTNVNKKQQNAAKEDDKKVTESNNSSQSKIIKKGEADKEATEVTNETSVKDETSKDEINTVVSNIYSLIENLQLQPEVKVQLKELIEALISGDNATMNALKQINNESSINLIGNMMNANSNSDLSSILNLLTTSTLEDGNSKNTLFEIETLLNNLVIENLETNESSLGVAKNDKFSSLENVLISKLRANLKNKLIDEQASGNQEGVIQREPLNDFEPPINIYGKNFNKNGVDDKNLTKEFNFLEKLSEGEKTDSKISRVSNFLTTLSDNKINLNSSEINNNTPIYISKGTFNEDVVKAVKFMNLNNLKDLSVKIYPKELGEVVISVSMEQGGLKAVIKAANKDTVDLLNLGLRDINEKLSQNNVKIQSLDIALYNEDTTFFANGNKEQQQKQFNGKNNKTFNLEVEEEKINEVVEDGAVNLLI